ncbi:hypothetical protein EHS25_003951 [Saitozyma podzolica]|uniref:Uncharacterized protein n=1 Tax=Saitozyma podzolica TaxID=1890683 RepID=A0A427YSM4_9TREE|nr:hypothetical protein EHS25_003951 [Saitozyma podzolica]
MSADVTGRRAVWNRQALPGYRVAVTDMTHPSPTKPLKALCGVSDGIGQSPPRFLPVRLVREPEGVVVEMYVRVESSGAEEAEDREALEVDRVVEVTIKVVEVEGVWRWRE